MKALIVLGTRPEIIKFYPFIKALKTSERIIVHTGQHYDYLMSQKFLEELKLPKIDYYLNIRSGSHAEQTSKMMVGLERVILKERPDTVIGLGDTNTTLAAAITSVKMGVHFTHIEAGLRSHDWSMPEEINRIVADHVASLLFAPTEFARTNLSKEGINKNVFVTGNTIVDVCREYAKKIHPARAEEFVLATIHRAENVDSPNRLLNLYKILMEFPATVIFPMHPRTKKALRKAGLLSKLAEKITIIEPVGYCDFLSLMMRSKFVITDSGGIQEETATLGVPCLTLRENTERPESVLSGSNIVVGTEPDTVLEFAERLLTDDRLYAKMKRAKNPFGDGHSGEKIAIILRREL